jgi:hypothetical protein
MGGGLKRAGQRMARLAEEERVLPFNGVESPAE